MICLLITMPPSALRISSSAQMQLATTCGSRSRSILYSVSTRSVDVTASGDTRKSLMQPMTAVLRTYGLWSCRPAVICCGRYSTMLGRRSDVKLRSASPRVIGSSSRQSFCSVLIASSASSGCAGA